jgi:hypothetical protein
MLAKQPQVAARLPNARLVPVEGGGVFMMDERVETIAPLVVDFIQSSTASPRRP